MARPRPRRAFPAVALTVLCGVSPSPVAPHPDPRYQSYEQIAARLEAWEISHPAIFRLEAIGLAPSTQKPIWAAKVSDSPWIREEEPVIWFQAAIHACEANGPNAILRQIETLLTGYGHDGQITAFVNNLEIWFVPVLNVDGYDIVFGEEPYALFWRKNLRDNDQSQNYTFPVDGVDLNRNWDYRWEEYPATDHSSHYYKGPAPFSEPEVLLVRERLLAELPVLAMDYHSPYQSSPGNVIWWPWRNTGQDRYGPDSVVYQAISIGLGNRTQAEVDTAWYQGAGAGRDLLPKEQNWLYSRTGVCILLMEIGETAWWEGAIVDTIAARVARGSLYLLERGLSGPGVTGKVTDAETGEPLFAEVRVEEMHDPAIGPRTTEGVNGRFWRFLPAGSYSLTVSASGYYQEQAVLQTSGYGWARRDFALTRLAPMMALESGVDAGRWFWVPNPARAGAPIALKVPPLAVHSLALFDVAGRQVCGWTSLPGKGLESHPSLPPRLAAGVYWLRLTTEGGTRTGSLVATP